MCLLISVSIKPKGKICVTMWKRGARSQQDGHGSTFPLKYAAAFIFLKLKLSPTGVTPVTMLGRDVNAVTRYNYDTSFLYSFCQITLPLSWSVIFLFVDCILQGVIDTSTFASIQTNKYYSSIRKCSFLKHKVPLNEELRLVMTYKMSLNVWGNTYFRLNFMNGCIIIIIYD